MFSEISLYELKDGTWGRIDFLDIDGGMRRRLQDLGLISGTKVKCIMHSPSGDPAAFLIRGAVIALRSEDSSRIFIRPLHQ